MSNLSDKSIDMIAYQSCFLQPVYLCSAIAVGMAVSRILYSKPILAGMMIICLILKQFRNRFNSFSDQPETVRLRRVRRAVCAVSYLILLRMGFALQPGISAWSGGLLHRLFTLIACAMMAQATVCFCGTFRLFRLIGSPPDITSGHPALWSPDFPPR